MPFLWSLDTPQDHIIGDRLVIGHPRTAKAVYATITKITDKRITAQAEDGRNVLLSTDPKKYSARQVRIIVESAPGAAQDIAEATEMIHSTGAYRAALSCLRRLAHGGYCPEPNRMGAKETLASAFGRKNEATEAAVHAIIEGFRA